MKKYKRVYLVANEKTSSFIKLESELPFSILEGRAQLEESYPKAKQILHIPKAKAEELLNLS